MARQLKPGNPGLNFQRLLALYVSSIHLIQRCLLALYTAILRHMWMLTYCKICYDTTAYVVYTQQRKHGTRQFSRLGRDWLATKQLPIHLSWWYICFRNGRCMDPQDLWVSATSMCAMTTTGGLEEERVAIKGVYNLLRGYKVQIYLLANLIISAGCPFPAPSKCVSRPPPPPPRTSLVGNRNSSSWDRRG